MKNIFSIGLSARRRESARRYMGADKSDPHTFNRAITHNENGVCSFRTVTDHGRAKEVHCHYDTDTYPGTRDLDPRWAPLQEWQRSRKLRVITQVPVTIHKNVCRP